VQIALKVKVEGDAAMGMPNAYIFHGFPGSGKSYLANKMAKKSSDLVIIGADAIGAMLKGQYSTYSDNFMFMRSLAGDIVQESVKVAIKHNLSFIIDETALTKNIREKWINFIEIQSKLHFRKYAIYVVLFPNLGLKKSLENRMKDPKGISGTKWKKILKRMQEMYEPIESPENHPGVHWIDAKDLKVKDLKGTFYEST